MGNNMYASVGGADLTRLPSCAVSNRKTRDRCTAAIQTGILTSLAFLGILHHRDVSIVEYNMHMRNRGQKGSQEPMRLPSL